MQIQVNTDNNITGREDVVRLVHSSVEGTVGRFSDRITRVEAHLSDTNSHKSKGDDKRCLLEARLAGLQPIAVSHLATDHRDCCDWGRRQTTEGDRKQNWTCAGSLTRVPRHDNRSGIFRPILRTMTLVYAGGGRLILEDGHNDHTFSHTCYRCSR